MDSRARNKAFAEELGVKFPILSDEDKHVSREYGVLMPVIRLSSRTTFVIDRQGTIQSIQKGGEALNPENAQKECGLMEHRK